MGLSRRHFLKGAGVAAAGSLLGGCVFDRFGFGERRKPNIIYILADDLGYGDLGCYGQRRIQTPNIDAMAAEGIRFTQHYAGSTVCAPSRCVLMTGLHTGHAGFAATNKAGVPPMPDDVTMAEQMRRRRDMRRGWSASGDWVSPGTTGVPNKQGSSITFSGT